MILHLMSPNTHRSTSRFRSTGADFGSLLHIPSDEKQHRSLISVIFQKQTYDLIQLSDDFCVFVCFLFLCGIVAANLDPMTHLRVSAGCDLIIHVVALLVQFLGKETFAKTRVIATRFQHHICHQTKEANSHILYVKTQYGSKFTFLLYFIV